MLSYARRVPVSLLKESLLNGTPEEVEIEQAASGGGRGLVHVIVLCGPASKSWRPARCSPRILRGFEKD